LLLPTWTLEIDNQLARYRKGHSRPVIFLDERKSQINAGSRTSGCVKWSIFQENCVIIYL